MGEGDLKDEDETLEEAEKPPESEGPKRKISTLSLFTGNYLVLIVSWILIDFAGELPGTYYSDYVVTLSGGNPNVGSFVLGVIMMVSMLCIASVQFLGGYMADRYGRRKLIVVMTFGVAFSYIFYAIAPNWHFILIGSAIQSLALVYQPALMAILTDSIPAEKRGTGFTIWNVITRVATTPAPVVAVLLVTTFGSVLGMRIAYAIVTLLFLSAAIWRFRLKESMEKVDKFAFREALGSYPRAFREGIGVWKKVPRSAIFLLASSMFLFFSFSMIGTLFLVYAFYQLQIGGTPNLMLPPEEDPALQLARIRWGYVQIALFLTMVIMSFPIGKLIDKIGRKRPLIFSWLLSIPATLIFVFGYYPIISTDPLVHVIIAMILIGISQLLGFAASQALFADLIPQEFRGKAVGTQQFFGYLIMAVGGLLGGLSYGIIDPRFPFLLMTVLVIPAILLVVFGVKEPKTEEREAQVAGE
ncbi:MAG: MFS transporter [Promethearchaeota archaeon]